MCEVITEAIPASTAAANGTSSRAAQRRQVGVDGRQLEVAVLRGVAVAREVLGAGGDARPPGGRSTQAATCARDRAGSVPKLRVPITGLSGLLFTSATGPRSRSMPTAASSAPMARPVSRVRSRSSAAPSAAGPSTGLPSSACRRVTSPPSSSTAMTARGLAARIAARERGDRVRAVGGVAAEVGRRRRGPRPAARRSRRAASYRGSAGSWTRERQPRRGRVIPSPRRR